MRVCSPDYTARSSMHALFDSWVSADADSLSGEGFVRKLRRLLVDKLPGFDYAQTLTNWRDHAALFDDIIGPDGNARIFMSLLHSLLQSAVRGEEVNEPLGKLLSWLKENGARASHSKAFPPYSSSSGARKGTSSSSRQSSTGSCVSSTRSL
jgi:hypothetical protein